MRRRSFSMLELIIVVVCIAVVAVGVLPMLSKSREHRHGSNCAGNLKQIGLALLMYSGENSGFFIIPENGNNFEPLNTETILNDGKVYDCPDSPVRRMTARHSEYYYGGSGIKDDNASPTSVTVARDESGNHPENRWMNVLFVDGHVEGARPDGSRTWNTYSGQNGAGE